MRAPEIPPLENGDVLTRTEFYRRWEAMSDLKRAERIEGVVYMAAAVRRQRHSRPHGDMLMWVGNYSLQTPGTEAGLDATLQLDAENDVQADIYLLIDPQHGGRCRFTDDDYIIGGPEFVVEIAASSASRDLHQKFHVYRRSGVKEYVVWKTLENEIVWFRLQDELYVEVEPEDGIIRSTVFPGLWLDVTAMTAGNLKGALETLSRGIASPEHAGFVQQLASRRKTDDRSTSPEQIS